MRNLLFRAKLRLIRACLLTLGVLLPAEAWAQPVNAAREGNSWIGLVVAVVLALIIAVVSFMSPKRGHQD